ncbi:PAS domain S-box protein [Cyanobacteria bacterium FACHB-471]|nr:PAS domain S-box protein [Cyanobacteria bacterium FACHB-471]
MKALPERIVAAGFGLAIFLLCGVSIASYFQLQKLVKNKQWIIHTYKVIGSIDNAFEAISEAENAHRDYLSTRRKVDLDKYHTSVKKATQSIEQTRQLTIDNPTQQQRLERLEPLIEKRLALLDQSVSLIQHNQLETPARIAFIEQGGAVQPEIRSGLQSLKIEEYALLQERAAATGFSNICLVICIGYFSSFILLIWVYRLLNKQIGVSKALSEEAIRLEQQATKSKLENILERITDAFVALDPEWRYTYVNQRAGHIFNRDPKELVGKNIWEEFPKGIGQKLSHAYYQAVTEQRIVQLEEYYPIWDKWFESRIYPSREGLLIFFQDITARKQAEIALTQSEQRYRSLAIASAQVIWLSDANGKTVGDTSAWQQLTGQTDAEIKGLGWLEAIHPDSRERIHQSWLQAIATQSLYEQVQPMRTRDGSYRDFWVRGVPVREADGTVREWIGTCTDITERKQAEEALRQAKAELEIKVQERTGELVRSNQELELFASVASHDLQEPLRAISGFTQLLMQDLPADLLDESTKEYMHWIVDGTQRMQQLIHDLLAYSRVGTHDLVLTPTDCNEVLEQVSRNLQVAIAENNAAIFHDSLPMVIADKTQLIQLFQNLIGNAIKFRRKEPPKIYIRVEQTALEQIFSIRDNGIGIQPRYLEQIFEVFKRLHTRQEFPGTGIGLAICKKIVDRHGGRLWAESQPDEGTTFYFTLPNRE